MNDRLELGIALFVLGLLGVFSMLLVDIPIPLDNMPKESADVIRSMSKTTLKMLTLLNPTILLFISIAIGLLTFNTVRLSVPSISRLLKLDLNTETSFMDQIKFGATLGLGSGIIISLISFGFQSIISTEMSSMGENIELHPLTRLLYGGITEEILLRFGMMSLIVFLLFKATKSLSALNYWIAIIISSIIFGIGHFPVVFQTVSEPSAMLLLYILIGNSVAGLIFGWLYWKKGLEAAFIGHMFAHIAMMIIEKLKPA